MNNGRVIFGVILVIVGISTLLDINIWPLLWPLFLIFVGLKIMGIGNDPERRWEKIREEKSDEIDETIVLSGINKKIMSGNFSGGKITAVLGGGEIDLREVTIASDNTVNLEAVMVLSGIKILVPKTWKVRDEITGVAGGLDDKTIIPKSPQAKLVVKGTVLLGGIEVLN